MRRLTLGLNLRRISQLALCMMLAKPCVSSANPRTIKVLEKAYVALSSRERSDLDDQEKKAKTLERAQKICAFELAPHNSWRANGEWKLVVSEIEALLPEISEPEPTGCLGVVKKHKVFKRVTCIRDQNPTLADIDHNTQRLKSGQIKLKRPLSLIRAQSQNGSQPLSPNPNGRSLSTFLFQKKSEQFNEQRQAQEAP